MSENTLIRQKEDSFGGILDTDIEDFITHLRAAGYARRTLRKKRSVVRSFARWSRRRKWPVVALSEVHVESFLERSPRQRKARKTFEAAALRPFLDHLSRTGKTATTTPPVGAKPTFEWEQRFVDFLRDQRGLAERSVQVYAPHAHNLLLDLVTKHGSADPQQLKPEMVHHFLLERAQGRSSESARLLAAALRSFFRFLHYRRRLGRGAAHLFRHGLASQMIQHGANLSEIAEVLRHRSQGTTEIYTKVDLPALREVARPWPGGGGGR